MTDKTLKDTLMRIKKEGGIQAVAEALMGPMARKAQEFSTSDRLSGQFSVFDQMDSKAVGLKGLEFLSQYLIKFAWPMAPEIGYRGMKHSKAADDGSILEGMAMFGVKVLTPSGIKKEFEIPLVIRQGNLLEPSVMLLDGTPRIICQDEIDGLMNTATFMDVFDVRGGIYAPPLPREICDSLLEMREELGPIPHHNPGMYVISQKKVDPGHISYPPPVKKAPEPKQEAPAWSEDSTPRPEPFVPEAPGSIGSKVLAELEPGLSFIAQDDYMKREDALPEAALEMHPDYVGFEYPEALKNPPPEGMEDPLFNRETGEWLPKSEVPVKILEPGKELSPENIESLAPEKTWEDIENPADVTEENIAIAVPMMESGEATPDEISEASGLSLPSVYKIWHQGGDFMGDFRPPPDIPPEIFESTAPEPLPSGEETMKPQMGGMPDIEIPEVAVSELPDFDEGPSLETEFEGEPPLPEPLGGWQPLMSPFQPPADQAVPPAPTPEEPPAEVEPAPAPEAPKKPKQPKAPEQPTVPPAPVPEEVIAPISPEVVPVAEPELLFQDDVGFVPASPMESGQFFDQPPPAPEPVPAIPMGEGAQVTPWGADIKAPTLPVELPSIWQDPDVHRVPQAPMGPPTPSIPGFEEPGFVEPLDFKGSKKGVGSMEPSLSPFKNKGLATGARVETITTKSIRNRGGGSWHVPAGTAGMIIEDIFGDGTRFKVRIDRGGVGEYLHTELKKASRSVSGLLGEVEQLAAQGAKHGAIVAHLVRRQATRSEINTVLDNAENLGLL